MCNVSKEKKMDFYVLRFPFSHLVLGLAYYVDDHSHPKNSIKKLQL